MRLLLKRLYLSGELGNILNANCLYSKGIKNNGSHAIDLFRYIFGDPLSFLTNFSRIDYKLEDPSVSASINYADFCINLLPLNEKFYSIFELDFLFERSRYRFFQSGLQLTISSPKKDNIFKDYIELATDKTIRTGFNGALESVIYQAILFANGLDYDKSLEADKILGTQFITERLASMKMFRPYKLKKSDF